MNIRERQGLQLSLAAHGKVSATQLRAMLEEVRTLASSIIAQISEVQEKEPEELAEETAALLVQCLSNILELL